MISRECRFLPQLLLKLLVLSYWLRERGRWVLSFWVGSRVQLLNLNDVPFFLVLDCDWVLTALRFVQDVSHMISYWRNVQYAGRFFHRIFHLVLQTLIKFALFRAQYHLRLFLPDLLLGLFYFLPSLTHRSWHQLMVTAIPCLFIFTVLISLLVKDLVLFLRNWAMILEIRRLASARVHRLLGA